MFSCSNEFVLSLDDTDHRKCSSSFLCGNFSENVTQILSISQKNKEKVKIYQKVSKEYNRKHFYATTLNHGALIV